MSPYDQTGLPHRHHLPANRQGWLYLAAEMDQCSRRILGWSTDASLATALPASALERALGARDTDLLHHSDHSCQYTSEAFCQRLAMRGITQTMSRTYQSPLEFEQNIQNN